MIVIVTNVKAEIKKPLAMVHWPQNHLLGRIFSSIETLPSDGLEILMFCPRALGPMAEPPQQKPESKVYERD